MGSLPLQLALCKSALAAYMFPRKALVYRTEQQALVCMSALAEHKPALALHKRELVAGRMYLAEHSQRRQALVYSVAELEALHKLVRNCGRFHNHTHYRSGFVLVQ